MGPKELQRIAYDPAAFEAFYREHVEAIQRFLARRLSDPQLVADLTADVFLAAMSAAFSYEPGRGAPRAWLYGIASNAVANAWRRDARERRALRRIEGRTLLDGDDLARIHERIDAAAQARALHTALACLSESERAVLELVVLDELSANEAAAALGIRPATARVRLHRARKALRRELAPQPSPNLEAAR
jgi:RNA polymerase sigma-70 factor (ECF subfamily)